MPNTDMDAGFRSPKNIAVTVGGIALALAVAVGLVFLARGSGYDLTVEDPFLGAADAPILVEEFGDFQCPACKQAAVAVEEVLRLYPTQVKMVFKDFPIPGHAHATSVAAAALCSAQQGKFSEFYSKLYETQTDWSTKDEAGVEAMLLGLAGEQQMNIDDFNACRNSRTASKEISDDSKEGIERGVDSTPTFFIDGEKQEGVLTVFQWIQRINAALEKKGLEPESPAQPADLEEPAE